MAAPPSWDNIAFLPECFRTFQLDSRLWLLELQDSVRLCVWIAFIWFKLYYTTTTVGQQKEDQDSSLQKSSVFCLSFPGVHRIFVFVVQLNNKQET